jgi:DNA-binding transcriptional ArsR family regulator
VKQQEAFRALADPSRRRILKLLQRRSMTAGEIAESFDFSAPSLSHHFSVLKAADLVRTERRGQNVVYSLNTSVLEDIERIIIDLFGNWNGKRS